MIYLSGILPGFVNGGLESTETEQQSFDIEIVRWNEENVVVFSTLTIQQGMELVSVGIAAPINYNDERDILQLTKEDLAQAVVESQIVHAVYDSAAIIARQIIATLNFSIEVPRSTIDPTITVEVHSTKNGSESDRIAVI